MCNLYNTNDPDTSNNSIYNSLPCVNCDLYEKDCECEIYEPYLEKICEYCNYYKVECVC
jgi:hypothetical protein